ncbi:MAG: urea ABC transporter substrate-binding protein [Anaerolineae bacterium]|nr:urea ABC transporter substrate-binding protein [Anaerolineae bacterium]MDW8170850.1 urea ABC transporter substrate-binding protein [Anaerolineae bacterium]
MKQRRWPYTAVLVLLAVVIISIVSRNPSEPIKIGVLHSLSGTMAFSESSVVDATLLAIEEINARGGLLGRPLEAIVSDGRSDWQVFARQAEALIRDEGVQVIFGCWTSACRKTVKPVFEAYNHLLIYPVQYEGLEASPNIVYTGAAPNQQIIPAVRWGIENLGRRVFLVGSDYVFPRTANEIIRRQVQALEGEIVGEAYLLLGDTAVQPIIETIIQTQPDFILNTINGDSNIAFFDGLRAANIRSEDIPTLSFSIAEPELQTLTLDNVVGDYAAWTYFQSIDRPENQAFVERFHARYGEDRVISDPMEAAYFGVYLWSQAVTDAGDTHPQVVRRAMHRQSFNAPQGVVYVDPQTQHVWKTVLVGQIGADGQFKVVWSSVNPVRPLPYLAAYRTQGEWDAFLHNLYMGWGQRWANPGTEVE